jgi:hypothetical protein
MRYESHNFILATVTLAIFWSSSLVCANQSESNRRLWNLFLNELNEAWASKITRFDYIILVHTVVRVLFTVSSLATIVFSHASWTSRYDTRSGWCSMLSWAS